MLEVLKKPKSLTLIVFLLGLIILGKPTYYYMKGICAQLMLKRAWEITKRTGNPTKAWSWADTLPVAKLTIPSIGLDQIVLDGKTNEAMAFGPAIIDSKTNLKNIIIAAHRDSFFSNLGKLNEGDIINLEFVEKNIKYRINNIVITNPEDTRWMDPDLDGTLTLITCYPFNFIGDAPKRYVVVANTF